MTDESERAHTVRALLSDRKPRRSPGIVIHQIQNVFVIGDQHAELLRQIMRAPRQPSEE